MKNWEIAPACAVCVENPAATGTEVPVVAAIIVVIVVLLSVALAMDGKSAQVVVTTLATGGLLGTELVRRLVETLAVRRAS